MMKERKENTISKSEEMYVSNQNEIVLKNSKLIFSSESIAGALILLWLPGFGLKMVANALFYLFKVGRAASEEWRQRCMRLDGVQHSEFLGEVKIFPKIPIVGPNRDHGIFLSFGLTSYIQHD